MPVQKEVANLLRKFGLTQADLTNVRIAGQLLESQLPAFIQEWYEWLAQEEEYQFFSPAIQIRARACSGSS